MWGKDGRWWWWGCGVGCAAAALRDPTCAAGGCLVGQMCARGNVCWWLVILWLVYRVPAGRLVVGGVCVLGVGRRNTEVICRNEPPVARL